MKSKQNLCLEISGLIRPLISHLKKKGAKYMNPDHTRGLPPLV